MKLSRVHVHRAVLLTFAVVIFSLDETFAGKTGYTGSSSPGYMGSSGTGYNTGSSRPGYMGSSGNWQNSSLPSSQEDSSSSTNYQQSRPSYYVRKSNSSGGLPSLGGLTHGLGLRKRRASGNKGTNKKPTDKDSVCTCQSQYDPVCVSDGKTTKTYTNKCMFQCQMKKMKAQQKKDSKNSKKNTNKIPSLKIVKKGTCESSTTAATPTVTELTGTVNETLSGHLPIRSMSTTAAAPSANMYVRKY